VLPGKKYHPEEIGGLLWRRRWFVALPFAICLVAGVFVASRLPDQYRSETLIMVVPQRIPDEYVTPTITGSIHDRLPSISEQILSRSRLERIITDFDLYKAERASGILEDIVQRMRADIDVNLVKDASSFRVSYTSSDPKTAQTVTGRLASLFIEENLRDRETLADGTSEFLESQLEEAKRRLLEHEKKLETYRRNHSGQLPSQLESNLQAIQSAQMLLQNVNESTNRARERRLLFERQLAEAEATPAPLPVSPAGEADAVPLTAAQQLEAGRARLEAMKVRYKPDHPDVRTLQRALAELEVKAAAEAAASPPGTVVQRSLSPAELLRQKKISDLEAEIVVIDRQLAANQAEDARLKNTIAQYQANVAQLPTRESELVELTRDYSTLQSTYASLLAKREDSKLAANLERRQIGEQFKVLDPASFPQKPSNQKVQLAAVAGGAAGGLLIGLLLVGLSEYRDSTFKQEQDVVRVLTLPVLALVPTMPNDGERAALRRRALLMNVGGTTILLACTVALILVWRLQP
jgi:polysaccharide chain length determinant protein (PEP-CTERM system associated)